MPGIIQGEKILTLALLNEKGRYDGDDPEMVARKSDAETYLINGTRILVPYAHVADEILFCANVEGSESGDPTLFRIEKDASGLQMTRLETLSFEKTVAIEFQNVEELFVEINPFHRP